MVNLINLLSRGQYEEVFEAIAKNNYCSKIPEGRIWEIRGLAHYGLLEIPSSISDLETANTLVPLSLVAQISLASCYLQEKFVLSAEAIYTHLMAQVATFQSHTICTGVAEGLTRLELNSEARQVCQRSLLRFPKSHRLNFLCGINLREENEPAVVIKDYFQRALSQNPHSIHYAIEYAKECLTAGDIEEAANTLRPLDPKNLHCVAALQRLRLVYAQMNDDAMKEICDDHLRVLYYKMQSKYQ